MGRGPVVFQLPRVGVTRVMEQAAAGHPDFVQLEVYLTLCYLVASFTIPLWNIRVPVSCTMPAENNRDHFQIAELCCLLRKPFGAMVL